MNKAIYGKNDWLISTWKRSDLIYNNKPCREGMSVKNWIRQYMGKMIDSFPHEKDQTLLIIISLVERECL